MSSNTALLPKLIVIACFSLYVMHWQGSVRVLVHQITVLVCHIITCYIQYHLQCKVIYVVAELSNDEVILACRMVPLLPTSWRGEVDAQFEDGLDLPSSWHVYVNGNGVIIVGILSDPWPVNGNPERDHRWLCVWRLRPLPDWWAAICPTLIRQEAHQWQMASLIFWFEVGPWTLVAVVYIFLFSTYSMVYRRVTNPSKIMV